MDRVRIERDGIIVDIYSTWDPERKAFTISKHMIADYTMSPERIDNMFDAVHNRIHNYITGLMSEQGYSIKSTGGKGNPSNLYLEHEVAPHEQHEPVKSTS